MMDALVRELNRLGYQPVLLPRSEVVPPEMYNYSRELRRLIRRGPLSAYLPAARDLRASRGALANISYKYTSAKNHEGAVAFLENVLRCIGIDAIPKLDLSFAGSNDFAFAFTDVTYMSVDPSLLDPLIRGLAPDGIPVEYVELGRLHIAYEYAYARELVMSRSDKKSFAADISAKVGEFVDLGANGSVAATSQSVLSFKANGPPAAFAYKAGQLVLEGSRWTFKPEEIGKKGADLAPTNPYVPQLAVVLPVVDEK